MFSLPSLLSLFPLLLLLLLLLSPRSASHKRNCFRNLLGQTAPLLVIPVTICDLDPSVIAASVESWTHCHDINRKESYETVDR